LKNFPDLIAFAQQNIVWELDRVMLDQRLARPSRSLGKQFTMIWQAQSGTGV
jgi:hypothetical protein